MLYRQCTISMVTYFSQSALATEASMPETPLKACLLSCLRQFLEIRRQRKICVWTETCTAESLRSQLNLTTDELNHVETDFESKRAALQNYVSSMSHSEVGAVPANHLLQSACLLLCEEITSAPLPSNLDVLDKWSVFVSLVLHLLSALLFPYVALRLNSCVQRVRASITKSPSIVEFNPQVRCLDVGKCFVVPRY